MFKNIILLFFLLCFSFVLIFAFHPLLYPQLSRSEFFNQSINNYILKTFKQFRYANENEYLKIGTYSFPILKLSIAPENIKKLKDLGEEASRRRIYVAKKQDWVPAYLKYPGVTEPIKVSLRLKGKWNDHRTEKGWSMLVKAKNRNYVLGMDKFQLQVDGTRNGHKELLLNKQARSMGLISPEILYVNVEINGFLVGMMMMEQSLTPLMLEKQQRKYGPILAFDTTPHWQQIALHRTLGLIDLSPFKKRGDGLGLSTYIANLNLKVFEGKKLLKKNPQLYYEAIATMRGYLEKKLPIHQVFNLVKLGQYMALIHSWKSNYSLYFTNMKWYFDPLTKLFEPIITETLPGLALGPTKSYLYEPAFSNFSFMNK